MSFCDSVLKQALCGLDYLANRGIVHGDIKPGNILYNDLGGGEYHFKIADFGLAHHQSQAVAYCGTEFYLAPELRPAVSGIEIARTPKTDIWSLFATIAEIFDSLLSSSPEAVMSHDDMAVGTFTRALKYMPSLEPMARKNPDHRASAAQMLVVLYRGDGLTTEGKIPPIPPPEPYLPPALLGAPPGGLGTQRGCLNTGGRKRFTAARKPAVSNS